MQIICKLLIMYANMQKYVFGQFQLPKVFKWLIYPAVLAQQNWHIKLSYSQGSNLVQAQLHLSLNSSLQGVRPLYSNVFKP